jgi:undecaprenyl-diphosphatase
MIAGRPFLNTASFGSYVDLVDARERLESKIGKWPAMVIALARVLRRATPVDVEIDGKRSQVWMAFIGNCRYSPAGFAPTWRTRLDDDVLDVRLVGAEHPYARLRLLWAVMTGTLSKTEVYRCEFVRGPITVRSLEGPLRLARDGETFNGPAEFTIEKAPERLAVFVPTSSSSDDPSSNDAAASHRAADRAR